MGINSVTTTRTAIEPYVELLREFQRVEVASTILGSNPSIVLEKKLASYLRTVSKSPRQLFRRSGEFQNILYKIVSTTSYSKSSNYNLADQAFLCLEFLLLGGTEYSIPTLATMSREDPTVFFNLVVACSSRKDRVRD